MAFQPVPDTCMVTFVGTLAGEQCVNTFYYKQETSWTDTELQDLADDLDAVWGGFVASWMYATYEYLRTEVKGLRSAADYVVSSNANAGTGGLTGGSSMPNNVAISVARKTGLTGKNARGRVFIPVTNTSLLNLSNTITSAFEAAIISLVEGLDAAASAIDWVPVTVSRVVAGVPLATAVTYAITSWVIVNLTVDSMRRRLPGRGS